MNPEEEDFPVLVAASKHSYSISAVKWALSNGIVKEGGTLGLVHVMPPLRTIPSPLGSSVPVGEVSPEMVATYKKDIQLKTKCYMEPHQNVCDAWKVHAELIIVEDDDIAKALLNQIIRLRARKFIMGASTRNPLVRKLKGSRIPEYIIKHAPETCTVLVVSKDKLLSVQEAKQSPLPHSHSNECRISDASSDTGSGSDNSSGYSSCIQSEKKLIRNESLPISTQKRAAISHPLPLQRLRAASMINLKCGLSNVGTLVNHTSDEKLHYISKLEVAPLCNENHTSEVWKPGNSPEERGPCGNDFFHFPSFSDDGHTDFSDILTTANVNYVLDPKDKGVKDNHLVCINDKGVNKDEINFHKLKLGLEAAQQRMIKAEREVTLARLKVKELDVYAKEESRKRDQALIIAEMAKKTADTATKKYGEALTALEVAKLKAEEEAHRRREAEARAKEEALNRQIAVSALKDANLMKYREYTYEELKFATNDFSDANQIGIGGYGPVYKGRLHHTLVAIKVLKKDSVQGPKEFQQEVDFLSRMHHPHLVLLLGACAEQACLVYEYLSNGSLDDLLLCKGDTPPLPWHTRFRIAAEVATALLFLHSTKPYPYVHRDLKPANILLDNNFTSKLGDVGLTRLAPSIASESITIYKDTNPVGTYAYIDPEYQRTGVFNPKSDIYALGIVMLQLLTGRGPIGISAIVEMALQKETLNEVLDSTCGEWPINEATEMAKIAIQCSQMQRRSRPDLETDVLPKLQKLRAFADDYIVQAAWRGRTVSQDHLTIPSFFLCPITKEPMKDPHIAADGYTYEYKAIKQWLREHKKSPVTNLKLPHKQLTPNRSLMTAISDWNQRLSYM